MVTALIALSSIGQGFQKGYVFESFQPKWAVAGWTSKDPFQEAWEPYAKALKEHPNYGEDTGWPERARNAIEGLGDHASADSLYEAAASYLTALDLDWHFELANPPFSIEQLACSSKLWTTLFYAWVGFSGSPKSKEFCRVGFAVCGPSLGPALNAGSLPTALLREFPSDRLVISSIVWYMATPGKPRTLKWMDWMLNQAKRRPSLPGFRGQDYLTIANAYGEHHWVKDTLADATGYRDNLRLFRSTVPAAFGHREDSALIAVNKHIKVLREKK